MLVLKLTWFALLSVLNNKADFFKKKKDLNEWVELEFICHEYDVLFVFIDRAHFFLLLCHRGNEKWDIWWKIERFYWIVVEMAFILHECTLFCEFYMKQTLNFICCKKNNSFYSLNDFYLAYWIDIWQNVFICEKSSCDLCITWFYYYFYFA